DEQSGSIVADIFRDNYWLASDGSSSASILIDLGVATTLSKIDLYNATNTGYNDRGTSNFHIEVANSITGNSATTYLLVSGLTVASGTMAFATPGVAPTAQTFALSSGSTSYRYVRFVVDSSKNNNPALHELRLYGAGNGVGGSTVYSQNTVSLNHAITATNDAPNVSASQPSIVLLDYQFTRNWGVSESKIAITSTDVDSSPVFDNAFLTSNGWGSADNGITFTKNVTYGSVKLDTTASTLTYYLDQQSNLTSRLRQGQTVTETIPVQVTDGQLTALTNAVFTIDGQNDEPELYLVNNLVGAFEDIEYEITYANLTNKSQLADIDGFVTAFVVKNVTSGVLKIGANSQSATPWNATNNATISTGLNGYWTPALNANGTLGAFTVVVKDDGGLNSLNPLQVNVQVASVNDRPFVTAGATVSYTENAAATVIDAGITITDLD
ncbi:hypothetical protein EBS67_17710, partial [bacterium]|nr:hypothetical protein [bacterium]